MVGQHKKTLKALVVDLRHLLEGTYNGDGRWQAGDLEQRLAAIGIRRDRNPVPADELPHLGLEDRQAREVVDAYLALRREAGISYTEAIAELVRETAYTWANRLLALRCMEARQLIDAAVILQKEVYGWRSLEHHRFAQRRPEQCTGEDDGLFAALDKVFTEQSKRLPLLFDPKAPGIALRPSPAAIKLCISLLSGKEAVKNQEPASDELFKASDTLGWAYQYWNTEEKNRVFERVRTHKGAKIEGADIVPATQLYTEPYMVKFLVQNSLGAIWIGMHPGSRLQEGWEYFVPLADSGPIKKKPVKEISFLDPACGSGHFLLEAFDLFYAMYEEEGEQMEPSKICSCILERNLYGIDIDERAVQIAEAALWMKAAEKAFQFDGANTNLAASNIRLPKGKDHLKAFLSKHPQDTQLRPALEVILDGMEHADELGSLLQIERPVDKELQHLKSHHDAIQSKGEMVQREMFKPTIIQGRLPFGVESYKNWKHNTLAALKDHFAAESESADLVQSFFDRSAGRSLLLIDLLARRYDVVAANPPFMGSKNMGPLLKKYVERHYAPGKRDLYAAFILRCLELAADMGRVAMVTQQSWMFLRSFADLRAAEEPDSSFQGLLRETTIETLAHLGPGAFGEISGEVVNIVLFSLTKSAPDSDHRLTAFRLIGPKSPEEKDRLLRQALNSINNGNNSRSGN